MKKIFHECSLEELRCIIKDALNESNLLKLQPAKEEDEHLSTSEACDMLRVSRTTLHNYVKKGIIECYKLGGRTYYSKNQIAAAIKESKGGQNV